jgi:hypothetical protein
LFNVLLMLSFLVFLAFPCFLAFFAFTFMHHPKSRCSSLFSLPVLIQLDIVSHCFLVFFFATVTSPLSFFLIMHCVFSWLFFFFAQLYVNDVADLVAARYILPYLS